MDKKAKFRNKFRVQQLYYDGHDSSVWHHSEAPDARGHLIEVRAPEYVSRPCWRELLAAADLIDSTVVRFADGAERAGPDETDHIYQFFFSDYATARKLAIRVQSSARNKRKDLMRRVRLDEAGGFHNQWAIDQLFEIQQGRCYYTRVPLTKSPKNFVKDHLISIFQGGTDWPGNLVLATCDANRYKGGVQSAEGFLQELAENRGQKWLSEQIAFCREVDRRRQILDEEFRRLYDR